MNVYKEEEEEEEELECTDEVSLDDLELVSLVKVNPGLWNNSLKIYSNANDKNLAWSLLGQSLITPLSGSEAQKKFINWRSTFGRLHKKILRSQPKSGSSNDQLVYVPTWPLYNELLFLKDVIKPRVTKSNFVKLACVPSNKPTSTSILKKFQSPLMENTMIQELSNDTMNTSLQLNELATSVDDSSTFLHSQYIESPRNSFYDSQTDVSDAGSVISLIAVQKYIIVTVVTICAIYMILKRRRQRRATRRWWVRLLNRNCNEKGFHLSLFRELKITDHEEFFSYTRMLPHQFNDLLRRIEPFLPPGGLRRPLPSELKLALTLGFLAHGDSARFKSWEFRIGRSTVYKIVQEVCKAIWKALQPVVLPQPDQLIWKQSAKGFFEKWQFPNCIGALDGKHIRIKAPPMSGSKYFCYKKFFSIVLMAICDYKYRFLWVDIGQFGSISDGGVWGETELGKCMVQGTLDIPPPCELPGTNIKTNHVLVADEAFPLNINLMKPYSQKFLASVHEDADNSRVLNYRLSRARRIIKNAFGILASRWQILLKGCNFYPENVDHIIKALVCLHNFVMDDEEQKPVTTRKYCPPNFIDRDDGNYEIMEDAWRGLIDNSELYRDLVNMKRNSGTNAAKSQRNIFREYFVSEAGCKQAPWQFELALRGHCVNPRLA